MTPAVSTTGYFTKFHDNSKTLSKQRGKKKISCGVSKMVSSKHMQDPKKTYMQDLPRAFRAGWLQRNIALCSGESGRAVWTDARCRTLCTDTRMQHYAVGSLKGVASCSGSRAEDSRTLNDLYDRRTWKKRAKVVPFLTKEGGRLFTACPEDERVTEGC